MEAGRCAGLGPPPRPPLAPESAPAGAELLTARKDRCCTRASVASHWIAPMQRASNRTSMYECRNRMATFPALLKPGAREVRFDMQASPGTTACRRGFVLA